jgi:phenylacetate-CoA ligase
MSADPFAPSSAQPPRTVASGAPMFQPDVETMPRPELEALQLRRLGETLARLRAKVPPIADRLTGLRDPTTLGDVATLPFTRKADLRDHYPFGLFAVPRHELVRVHASSGTTGKPTVVGYSRGDMAVWATCVARCLIGAGVAPGHLLHNAYGYGLFTGGLGLHQGAELAGIGVVPVSGGNTERQLLLLTDFRPEAICCTPSYALTLAELLPDGPRSSLQVGILGAEPWSDATRVAIEEGLGIRAVNIYGLSEVIGPGVSCEDVFQDGLYIQEDHFLPEIVDPDSGEPLPDGEVGVLVLTSLTKEAFPVLRYWTGDLCSITREPGRSGRTFARMSRVVGRSDDMLVIRGVNVYPSQVEHTLVRLAGLSPHFQLLVDRRGTLDTLSIVVEAEAGPWADGVLDPAALAATAREALRSSLLIAAAVEVVAPGSVPRSEGGKLSRVVDRRRV